MRIATVLALAISLFVSAGIFIPAPNLLLLPLGVIAPELSPWLVVLNLSAAIIAWSSYRPAVPFFIGSLIFSAWPLAQIPAVIRVTDQQLFSKESGDRNPSLTTAQVVLNCFRSLFKSSSAQAIEPEVLPLNIHLYRPNSTGPLPGLIDIYGGAWQRGSPTDNAGFYRYMASKGYAVFAIDYRHAPAAQYPAQIDDVRAAIAFIHTNAQRYGTDPDRLALCGRSAGAQLALLAAYEKGPVPIRAVISFYGPTDMALGYSDLPSPDPLHVRSVLETYLGGPPSQFPERYREASAVEHVTDDLSRRLPPTLLIQGSHDHIVKPVFARELYQRLLATHNRAVLLEVPWAEHAFDLVFFGVGDQLALPYIELFLHRALADTRERL